MPGVTLARRRSGEGQAGCRSENHPSISKNGLEIPGFTGEEGRKNLGIIGQNPLGVGFCKSLQIEHFREVDGCAVCERGGRREVVDLGARARGLKGRGGERGRRGRVESGLGRAWCGPRARSRSCGGPSVRGSCQEGERGPRCVVTRPRSVEGPARRLEAD